MNEYDLFEAIGQADEEMLEASERRPFPIWKPLLAAAACLVLILSVALAFVPKPESDISIALPEGSTAASPNPSTIPATTEPSIIMGLPGQIIYTEKIPWPESEDIYAASPEVNQAIDVKYAPSYQFYFQLSVEARVLEVLPDKYQFASDHTYGQKYRLLYMELLDPISISNMPSHFYYLLPEHLSTELAQFDSLILIVQQSGSENHILRNVSCSRMESFSFLFLSGFYAPHKGAVIACTDGTPDMTLWQLEGWRGQEVWPTLLADPERYSGYPGKIGRSTSEIKEAIRQGLADYQQKGDFHLHNSIYCNTAFNWPEAQAVLEKVTPFENGCYDTVTWASSERLVIYKLYINGFATNQSITVNLDEKAVEEDILFSEEDLKNLPQLELHMAAAHRLEPLSSPNLNLGPYLFCGVSGSYHKEGDHVFGVITVNWGYPDLEESDSLTCCLVRRVQTSTYLLVYPDGATAQANDRDDLMSLIAQYKG